MARNKEFDPSIVLHKSMGIFGYYGYEGTSLQNLIDGVGIARQSLYDTFGTKRDLFISAVTHYLNGKSATVILKLETSESIRVAIKEIFYEGINILKDEVKRNECFIMDSAIAQIPHNQEIADFFNKDLKRLEEAFYKALVRAQEQGEIERQKDIVALASYLNYSRYSLTQVAKLSSNPSVLDDLVSVILSTLD